MTIREKVDCKSERKTKKSYIKKFVNFIQFLTMLKEDIADPLQKIITMMNNLPADPIRMEDADRGISVHISFKKSAMISFDLSRNKEKDKSNFAFATKDFPIYSYHSSIARLVPIYDKLLFLGKHPNYANSDLMMSFSATISNVSLMLGEETLIKTENSIADLIPQNLKNELIIFCGPVGEYFVFTIHFVKLRGPPNSISMTAISDYNNFHNSSSTQMMHFPTSQSSSDLSQFRGSNRPAQTSPNQNGNSIPSMPNSVSNGNLSNRIFSALKEGHIISSSGGIENAAFWRPFVPETIISYLGKDFEVIDSVMMKTKFRPQASILAELKALQMQLSAISITLSVEAEEDSSDEEEDSIEE